MNASAVGKSVDCPFPSIVPYVDNIIIVPMNKLANSLLFELVVVLSDIVEIKVNSVDRSVDFVNGGKNVAGVVFSQRSDVSILNLFLQPSFLSSVEFVESSSIRCSWIFVDLMGSVLWVLFIFVNFNLFLI